MANDRQEIYDAIRASRGGRFYGKYRGKVIDNVDTQNRARLQVTISEVMGDVALWAMPCTPYAGKDVGIYAIPPEGANVWVEFEAGVLKYPIWSGCFWSSGDIPQEDATPEILFIRSGKAKLRIDNSSGEIRIESDQSHITLNSGDILIESATIEQSANGGKTSLTSSGFDAQQGGLKVSA